MTKNILKRVCGPNLTFLMLLLVAACSSAGSNKSNRKTSDESSAAPAAPAMGNDNKKISKDLIKRARETVFEVVTPRIDDEFMKYNRRLPYEKLPFQARNDKYHSIGTAFLIQKGSFATAAHLFDHHLASLPRDYYVRDYKGNLYKIARYTKYSQYRDIVTFQTEKAPETASYLELSKDHDVGDTVYSVGNAQGEGVAFRSGELASYTQEENDGAWSFIRFSAPVNPGNSGGPLMNSKGQVIGIIVRKNGGENLNMAVPATELTKLSNQKTEFYIKDYALEKHDENVQGNWKFSTSLPIEPKKLSQLAETSLRSFIEGLREKLYAKIKSKDYPRAPEVAKYALVQPYTTVLGIPVRDQQGNWVVSAPQHESVQLPGEQKVSIFNDSDKGSPIAQYRYYMLKPKAQNLKQFVANGTAINDTLIKANSWGRMFAGETIPVKSYGPAQKSSVHKDPQGRPWFINEWRTYFDGRTIVNAYTPVPDGVVGYWFYMPTSMETTGLLNSFRKAYMDNAILSYNAALKGWKEYATLAPEFKPSFMQGVQINNTKDNLNIKAEGLDVKLAVKDINDQTSISVYRGLDPKNTTRQRFYGFSVDANNSSQDSYAVIPFFNPKGLGDDQRDILWKRVVDQQAPYDGKMVKEKSSNIVLTVMGLDGKRSTASTKSVDQLFLLTCVTSAGDTNSNEKNCNQQKGQIRIY